VDTSNYLVVVDAVGSIAAARTNLDSLENGVVEGDTVANRPAMVMLEVP
jgi:hypothetical protein